MSGLTRKNQAGVSGLVGPVVHYTQFTTSTDGAGAWVKPDGVKVVWVEVVGAGGGGGGSNASGGESSGGGGGGAYAWACFSAAALPATLDVVVGAGGTGAESNAQNNGAAGGSSNINLFQQKSLYLNANLLYIVGVTNTTSYLSILTF